MITTSLAVDDIYALITILAAIALHWHLLTSAAGVEVCFRMPVIMRWCCLARKLSEGVHSVHREVG